MGEMIVRLIGIILLAATAVAAQSDVLFRHAADARLRHEFADPEISYMLFDAVHHELLASRWPNSHRRVSVGSILKPFIAMAYASVHGDKFPQHVCHGTADRCWLPRGHGSIGLEHAVAHSCNAYFRALAAELSAAAMKKTALDFALEAPPSFAPDTLVGLDNSWHNAPLQIVEAYIRLAGRTRNDGLVKRVLAGMALAADDGTGIALAAAEKPGKVLIKTGTASCTHERPAPGDGFAITLWPAEAPRYVLMVRRHGKPGSQAAEVAGKMIASLQEGARAAAD
jgi:cell division protein FtsI/penicillin-binding protein 2